MPANGRGNVPLVFLFCQRSNSRNTLCLACAAGGIVYCVIKVLAAEPRSKKKEWGRGVWYFSRLRRQLSLDWYSGSAAKSPSPSTQYRQLCRLPYALLMLVHLLQKYFLKIVAFVSKTIIELSVLCYNQTMCEVDQ